MHKDETYKGTHRDLRADHGVVVRAKVCLLLGRPLPRRGPYGLGGAGVFNLVTIPLAPWRNSGRGRESRLRGIGLSFSVRRRSRRFTRNRDFAFGARSFARFVGNDGTLFDFSTLRKRGKRDGDLMVLWRKKSTRQKKVMQYRYWEKYKLRR
jgi:hypothetical protein